MFVQDSEGSCPSAGPGAPPEMPLQRLGDEIGELAAHIAAATCRWLTMVAEFDRRDGHLEWGMHSAWVWLAWRCGLTPRAAQEHVRVARALEQLPRIHAAFARGELTYSKVRALTRVACENNEELLLSHARHATAAQLERICRAYRGVGLSEADRARERRHFTYSWDDEDGSFRFTGLLSGEEGALFSSGPRGGLRGDPRQGRGGRAAFRGTRRGAAVARRRSRGRGRGGAGLRGRHLDGRGSPPARRPRRRRRAGREPRGRRKCDGGARSGDPDGNGAAAGLRCLGGHVHGAQRQAAVGRSQDAHDPASTEESRASPRPELPLSRLRALALHRSAPHRPLVPRRRVLIREPHPTLSPSPQACPRRRLLGRGAFRGTLRVPPPQRDRDP